MSKSDQQPGTEQPEAAAATDGVVGAVPEPTASRPTLIRKVPGEVKPMGKLSHEAQKFQKEIKTKSVAELRDILARQDRILANAALLKTLPDKGDKVKQRKLQLEELIASRTRALNEAADLLASLSISSQSDATAKSLSNQSGASVNNNNSKPVDVDKMEWKFGGAHFIKKFGQLNPANVPDSDDDSDPEADPEGDPLKLLASRSEVPTKKSSSSLASVSPKNSYAKILQQQSDSQRRFIPSHSLRKSVLNETDKTKIHLKKTVDAPVTSSSSSAVVVTSSAAHRTDPIPPENMLKEGKFKTATLDLKESLEIQKEQAAALKQMQLEHAASRLKTKLRIPPGTDSSLLALSEEQRMAYRNVVDAVGGQDDYDENHEAEEEIEEVYDDADAPVVAGQVNFTITEYED